MDKIESALMEKGIVSREQLLDLKRHMKPGE